MLCGTGFDKKLKAYMNHLLIIFHDRINTIYQFIKPFLDKKKCLFFEEYEALKYG